MLVKFGVWGFGEKLDPVPGGVPLAESVTGKLQPPTEVTSTLTVGSGSVAAQTLRVDGVAARVKPTAQLS